jgi:hypothetical protein
MIRMETLGGFPYLPVFRLRRAKPGFAIATEHQVGAWYIGDMSRGRFVCALAIVLLSGCTKSFRVARVGLDCVLSTSDAGVDVLPFGKWLTATAPRFGQATTVTISDQGKVLGTVPMACVATALPPARTLWGLKSGAWVEPNQPTHSLSAIDHRVQPGQAVQVSGEGSHLLLLQDGLPRGIVATASLTDKPIPTFTALFAEALAQGDDNLSVLRAAETFEPSLLDDPGVAKAIPLMVQTRLQEGHLEGLRRTLDDMPRIRARFPDLAKLHGELAAAYWSRETSASSSPRQWALIVDTTATEEELEEEQRALRTKLAGNLFVIWRANADRLPTTLNAEAHPGVAEDHTWLVVGVCPEIPARALLDLYRPFIKGLTLREVDLGKEAPPCPQGPEYPHISHFPGGAKFARYWQREYRWGQSSMVFVAFDDKGKPSTGWVPTVAFSLGRIDPFAEEPVACFFNPDKRPISSFDAYCERTGEGGTVEQSGTFTVRLDKGRLRAEAKAHGRPVRARAR